MTAEYPIREMTGNWRMRAVAWIHARTTTTVAETGLRIRSGRCIIALTSLPSRSLSCRTPLLASHSRETAPTPRTSGKHSAGGAGELADTANRFNHLATHRVPIVLVFDGPPTILAKLYRESGVSRKRSDSIGQFLRAEVVLQAAAFVPNHVRHLKAVRDDHRPARSH